MSDQLVGAIRAVAGDGIAFDGLHVEGVGADCDVTVAPEGFEATGRQAVTELVATHPAYADNWYVWHTEAPQDRARWSFLRWLEGAGERAVGPRYDALATGITETWGQLAITVSLADPPGERALVDGRGGRSYEIRHVADRETDSADLTAHEDPHAASEIARFDDDGRYRPLKTAPSLRTGWRVVDLGPAEAVAAVTGFYPATVQNWHRERTGELDVTHFRAAADRQTGRYGSIADLPAEAVEWAATACCVDSQCLKRRAWDDDADSELAVPRGEGAFPCREPCSLFVAAAGEWTELEREESRTYEFELTPSERRQLEAIVDAVAEGRVGEIREADLDAGANRYRARYLRAKRFADGRLPDAAKADDTE